MARDPTVPMIEDLEGIFGNVVGAVLSLAGIVFFIILLMSGLKYMSAGGDPKAVEAAKKSLTTAIGGIVFIALAYLILVLIEEITGAKVTEFTIIGK